MSLSVNDTAWVNIRTHVRGPLIGPNDTAQAALPSLAVIVGRRVSTKVPICCLFQFYFCTWTSTRRDQVWKKGGKVLWKCTLAIRYFSRSRFIRKMLFFSSALLGKGLFTHSPLIVLIILDIFDIDLVHDSCLQPFYSGCAEPCLCSS